MRPVTASSIYILNKLRVFILGLLCKFRYQLKRRIQTRIGPNCNRINLQHGSWLRYNVTNGWIGDTDYQNEYVLPP